MSPLFLLSLLSLISVGRTVRITNIKVPSTYTIEESNNIKPLYLDCEYEMEKDEKGFVLKWLLNNNCIYQWIPSVKGFALGFMKSRINTNGPDKNPGFISISNADWNMTGEYTCLVQTFESTDRKSARLQIIVPESSFGLKLKLNPDKKCVNVFCNVALVYPQPIVNILINNEKLNGVLSKEVRDEDGLFTVSIKTEVDRDILEQPTPITCVFYLSGTNYTKRKETIFYDHQSLSTTVNPHKEEISSAISRLEAEKGTDCGNNFATTWPTLVFILCLVFATLAS